MSFSSEIIASQIHEDCERLSFGGNGMVYFVNPEDGKIYLMMSPNGKCLKDGARVLTATVAGGISSNGFSFEGIATTLGLKFEKNGGERRDFRFSIGRFFEFYNPYRFNQLFALAYGSLMETLSVESVEELDITHISEEFQKPELIMLLELLNLFNEQSELEAGLEEHSDEIHRIIELMSSQDLWFADAVVSSNKLRKNGEIVKTFSCQFYRFFEMATQRIENLLKSNLCAWLSGDENEQISLFNLVSVSDILNLNEDDSDEFGVIWYGGARINVDTVAAVRQWHENQQFIASEHSARD